MPKGVSKGNRVRGYTYARRKDGTKYRVYNNQSRRGRCQTSGGVRPYSKSTARRPAYPARASTYQRDIFGDTIMGYGRYYYKRGTPANPGKPIREPGVPRIRNTRMGTIISHKEFLTDVQSSVGFVSATFNLNPGLRSSFPWLALVAQCYEEWLPRGIVVEYRTTSSDTLNAVNPALGSVIIATQYNAANPDFVNKQQMENYEGAISCKPSVSMLHQVETKRKQNVNDEFYIRTGPPPANTDIRLYDLGKVQVSTVGSQATGNVIGEIWISYEVEFRKPKIPADPLSEGCHFSIAAAAATGESPANVVGTAAPSNQGGVAAGAGVIPFGGYLPTSGSTMFDARFNRNAAIYGGVPYVQLGQFSRGYYLVCCAFSWVNGGTQGTWTVTAQTGCTLVNAWGGGAAAVNAEVDGTTATAQTTQLNFVVNVTAAYATISFTNNSTASGGFAAPCDIFIMEMPDSIN